MPARDHRTPPANRSRTEPWGASRARHSRSVAYTTGGRYRWASVSSIPPSTSARRGRIARPQRRASSARFVHLTLPARFGTVGTAWMKPQSSKSSPDDDGSAAHWKVPGDRVTGEEDTIELRWYVRALQRRWLLVAVITLIAGGVAFWAASLQPLRYEGIT